MESNVTMTENEFPKAEEVRVDLSPLAADLKRISDRLMEIMDQMEGVGENHHQACECAAAEADHAEFLLPDFPEEAQAGKDAEGKTSADPSESGEDEETLAKLPHVIEEFLRHLNGMEKGMGQMVAYGREVGELGCEVLRCERTLRAFIESADSSPAPDPPLPPRSEGLE